MAGRPSYGQMQSYRCHSGKLAGSRGHVEDREQRGLSARYPDNLPAPLPASARRARGANPVVVLHTLNTDGKAFDKGLVTDQRRRRWYRRPCRRTRRRHAGAAQQDRTRSDQDARENPDLAGARELIATTFWHLSQLPCSHGNGSHQNRLTRRPKGTLKARPKVSFSWALVGAETMVAQCRMANNFRSAMTAFSVLADRSAEEHSADARDPLTRLAALVDADSLTPLGAARLR